MAKDKTNDMTVGNPVSLIIRFMIPMCLGNIFQQFYNIADSIVAASASTPSGSGRSNMIRCVIT